MVSIAQVVSELGVLNALSGSNGSRWHSLQRDIGILTISPKSYLSSIFLGIAPMIDGHGDGFRRA
ncbi:MAG: hypothetical protein AAGG51_15130 [Cyanobacteria bacterium P01_G01_bin.54]